MHMNRTGLFLFSVCTLSVLFVSLTPSCASLYLSHAMSPMHLYTYLYTIRPLLYIIVGYILSLSHDMLFTRSSSFTCQYRWVSGSTERGVRDNSRTHAHVCVCMYVCMSVGV